MERKKTFQSVNATKEAFQRFAHSETVNKLKGLTHRMRKRAVGVKKSAPIQSKHDDLLNGFTSEEIGDAAGNLI